jgi:hypothetical protein
MRFKGNLALSSWECQGFIRTGAKLQPGWRAGDSLPRVPFAEMAAEYPCPCCGHVIFLEPPGSYDICEICFWEDDIVMLRWPTTGGGANHVALVEAQSNYADFGASERAHAVHVRPATDDEPIEPGWRPIDNARDSFEPDGEQEAPWPEDSIVLYWWRPTFWRRDRQVAS